MASITSKIFVAFLRLIKKKYFLIRQFDKGRFDHYSSPRPPSYVSKICHVRLSRLNNRNVFTLTPNNNAGNKHILYLHGGAYVQSFVRPHWSFLAELVKTTHCTITAPDYPLAPAHTYEDAFDMVKSLYTQLIADIDPGNLILMGDSSGGGFALALAQQLRHENIPQPDQLILLSPWLDITLTNPEIKDIDVSDPFLGIEGLLKAGKAYAGETPPDHYLLSPVYGSLQGLKHISVFAGSNEILVADARKLKRLADTAGIDLNYYEYAEMFHAWMFLSFPESNKARKQIIELVMNGFHR